MVKYAGDADLKYAGYTGYTASNRGPITSTENITLSFDTVYYFDIDLREYTIEVEDVQNSDGSTETRIFHAKYGEAFDFSALHTTGTEKNSVYTAFKSITAFNSEGTTLTRDVNEIISGDFASELLDGQVTYRAQYQNNSGVITYKFSGTRLDPIHVVYKNGEMPTQNDFLGAIADVDATAYVQSISPALHKVDGDAVYAVTVSIPEKPLQKYTVSYELNGGSGESSVQFTERGVMTKPADPTRTGYTFKGWYYDSSFTTPMDWSRSMPSMNFTLYAKWDANTYTITFDAGEVTSATTSKDIVFDRMVGSLPMASRANYIFVGWFTAVSEGVQYTADTVYTIDRSITLYAHWQLKTTISPSSLTFSDNAAVTYDGKTHKPTLNCDISRIDVGSFSIQ